MALMQNIQNPPSLLAAHAANLETSSAWTDVQWVEEESILSASPFLTLQVSAYSTTQDTKVRVLERLHPNAPWTELAAETDVPTAAVDSDGVAAATLIYSDRLTSHEVKVQVQEGSTSGGAVTLSLCLK